MDYLPLRDFVLVSKDEVEERTSGGLLYRPSTVDDKIIKGTVLAVGSGRVESNGTVVPLEVKAGDKVLFNKTYSVELPGSSPACVILREEQLLCVVK